MFLNVTIKASEVLRWEIVKLKDDLKNLEEKDEKSVKDKEGMKYSFRQMHEEI